MIQCDWLIDFDVVRLRLWTAPTNGHIFHPPDNIILESDGGMILTGEKLRTRRKSCHSVTLSVTNPTRARTWASAVRGRRLTTWATAWPSANSCFTWSRNHPSTCFKKGLIENNSLEDGCLQRFYSVLSCRNCLMFGGAYSLHHQGDEWRDDGGSKQIWNFDHFLRYYRRNIHENSRLHTQSSQNLESHKNI
jgi:hypothetical protein